MSTALDLRDVARDPRKAAADGRSAETHSIPDQIAAEKFAQAQAAAARDGPPIKIAVFRPPGAI